jgi:hypothetical protein
MHSFFLQNALKLTPNQETQNTHWTWYNYGPWNETEQKQIHTKYLKRTSKIVEKIIIE